MERLGIDDFHEVEKLLERGEREGFLKARTVSEMGQLLLHGYGARLGTTEGEMAGFCALLPYPEENAAEIVGLCHNHPLPGRRDREPFGVPDD